VKSADDRARVTGAWTKQLGDGKARAGASVAVHPVRAGNDGTGDVSFCCTCCCFLKKFEKQTKQTFFFSLEHIFEMMVNLFKEGSEVAPSRLALWAFRSCFQSTAPSSPSTQKESHASFFRCVR